MQPQFVEVRKIKLPNGGELEVQMSAEFVQRVKSHFMITDDQPLDDDYVRMYFYGATKSALDKETSA